MTSMFIIAAKTLLGKLALTMLSERFMEWAFFKFAELLVSSTETKQDDEWLEKLKEEFYKRG